MSMSLNQPGRKYEMPAVKMPKWKLAITTLLPVILIFGLCFIFKGINSCPSYPADAPVTTVSPNVGMQGQTLSVVIRDTNAENHGAPWEDFFGSVSFGSGITVNNWVKNPPYELVVNISIADYAALGPRDIVGTFTAGGPTPAPASFTVIAAPPPQNPFISMGSHSSTVAAAIGQTTPIISPTVAVQSASLSAKAVTPGTPVTVTADITNKSTVNGNKKVTLYVNGQVDATQGVTVNSGSSTKLTFSISRNEPGDYSVYVDGIPAGSFKVEMMQQNDAVLIISVILLAIAFVAGIVLFWRRQQRAN